MNDAQLALLRGWVKGVEDRAFSYASADKEVAPLVAQLLHEHEMLGQSLCDILADLHVIDMPTVTGPELLAAAEGVGREVQGRLDQAAEMFQRWQEHGLLGVDVNRWLASGGS